MTSGCASIMQGSSQSFGISSTPDGASVTINNLERGQTPLVVDLKRKDNHLIQIKMPGYVPYSTTLTRRTSGWVWGNLAFGGLIGLAIDAISGGMYKLTPDQVQAVLIKEDTALLLQEDTLYIAVVLEPDPTWEKVGQLSR